MPNSPGLDLILAGLQQALTGLPNALGNIAGLATGATPISGPYNPLRAAAERARAEAIRARQTATQDKQKAVQATVAARKGMATASTAGARAARSQATAARASVLAARARARAARPGASGASKAKARAATAVANRANRVAAANRQQAQQAARQSARLNATRTRARQTARQSGQRAGAAGAAAARAGALGSGALATAIDVAKIGGGILGAALTGAREFVQLIHGIRQFSDGVAESNRRLAPFNSRIAGAAVALQFGDMARNFEFARRTQDTAVTQFGATNRARNAWVGSDANMQNIQNRVGIEGADFTAIVGPSFERFSKALDNLTKHTEGVGTFMGNWLKKVMDGFSDEFGLPKPDDKPLPEPTNFWGDEVNRLGNRGNVIGHRIIPDHF